MTTTLNNHWAIENVVAVKESEQQKLISDAIEFKTKDRINGIKDRINGTKEFDENLMGDKLDFKLPNFKPIYGIIHSRNFFSKSQKWVGHVIEKNEKSFTAKLEDSTNLGTYEIADFNLDEISPEDLNLLNLGSIFYWAIGTSMINGQVKKESIIRFQRVALWTEDDYNSSTDRADNLFNNLSWE